VLFSAVWLCFHTCCVRQFVFGNQQSHDSYCVGQLIGLFSGLFSLASCKILLLLTAVWICFHTCCVRHIVCGNQHSYDSNCFGQLIGRFSGCLFLLASCYI